MKGVTINAGQMTLRMWGVFFTAPGMETGVVNHALHQEQHEK